MPTTTQASDLFTRFEALGALGRLSLDCFKMGEWEVTASNTSTGESFRIDAWDMLDVVVKALNRAESLGWLKPGEP